MTAYSHRATDTASRNSSGANDLVLKSARGLLIFGKWVTLFATVLTSLALVAIPFVYETVLAEMADAFVNRPGPELVGMCALIFVLIIIAFLLTLFAINRLRKIVDSVGEGNPFTRMNGTRLRGIGIAALAIQVVAFVAALLATGLDTMLGETKPGVDMNISINADFSLSGILLVLLLILLARVFDRGAEMREELEGTI